MFTAKLVYFQNIINYETQDHKLVNSPTTEGTEFAAWGSTSTLWLRYPQIRIATNYLLPVLPY